MGVPFAQQFLFKICTDIYSQQWQSDKRAPNLGNKSRLPRKNNEKDMTPMPWTQGGLLLTEQKLLDFCNYYKLYTHELDRRKNRNWLLLLDYIIITIINLYGLLMFTKNKKLNT